MINPVYLAVAIGGGIGSILRYSLSSLIYPISDIPAGTLTVNLMGCFLLSFFYQMFSQRLQNHPSLQKGIATGLIGSFTTFSAFSAEFVQLVPDDLFIAMVYLLTTIFGGLAMTSLGLTAGRRSK
ncbi:fluoride efflux transporter CrcB [Halobacillus fulvus]|nr:fluoride efflux transporter CrcB [Halobacillus fulvus]